VKKRRKNLASNETGRGGLTQKKKEGRGVVSSGSGCFRKKKKTRTYYGVRGWGGSKKKKFVSQGGGRKTLINVVYRSCRSYHMFKNGGV